MITLENVKTALALTPFDAVAAHQQMAPLTRLNGRPPEMEGAARIAAVLLLLYCHQDELHLVLTQRRHDLNSHAGQISFPGGSKDDEEMEEVTALRETDEEVGVAPTAVTVLGRLTPIWIPPSDFYVHPFVGWVTNGERPLFVPAATEVAEILEVPLGHFLETSSRKTGTIERDNYRFEVPYFDVEGRMVWGATAVMLSEFVERLRQVIDTKT